MATLEQKKAAAFSALERGRPRLQPPASRSRPSRSSKRRRSREEKLAALVESLADRPVEELDRLQQEALQGGPGVPRDANARRLLLEALDLVRRRYGGTAEPFGPDDEPVADEEPAAGVDEG